MVGSVPAVAADREESNDMIELNPENVRFIIQKAREFQIEEDTADVESPPDLEDVEALEAHEAELDEDLSEDELIAQIERVKRALPGVPVGYVDAYYLFEKHPRVTAACDVILTNCYPFWEGCPRERAVAYMQDMVGRTVAVAGGKRVVVSETGWPDQGSAFHGAVPSVQGAMRYFLDTQHWARRDGVEVFWFAAFDEAWKVGAEGDVGAYWGLWDKDGRPKFG